MMNYPTQGGLGSGIGQAQTVDARPQTDIESAIRESDRITGAIAGAVEQLEQRLSSVLSASPPNEKGKDARLEPMRVPLANQIISITDVNEKSLARLMDILGRIQLPL